MVTGDRVISGAEGADATTDCNDHATYWQLSGIGLHLRRSTSGTRFPLCDRFRLAPLCRPIPDSLFPIPRMPARVENLRESTDRSVRLVALGHLADATAAQSRLANQSDNEALHDFRVALRRL